MMRSRTLLLVAILVASLATLSHGWARFIAPVLLPPPPSSHALHAASVDMDDLLSALPQPRIDARTEIDLFGNEIDHALAKYELDRTGGEYEVHSPDTELSRLGPPSS